MGTTGKEHSSEWEWVWDWDVRGTRHQLLGRVRSPLLIEMPNVKKDMKRVGGCQIVLFLSSCHGKISHFVLYAQRFGINDGKQEPGHLPIAPRFYINFENPQKKRCQLGGKYACTLQHTEGGREAERGFFYDYYYYYFLWQFRIKEEKGRLEFLFYFILFLKVGSCRPPLCSTKYGV